MPKTIEEHAAAIVAELTPQMIAYASDPARGDYRGFAALHDLCDANMLLPLYDDCPEEFAGWMQWFNLIIAEVNKILCAS